MRESGAVLGGEGNGGVIEPKVGFVRDSFVAMALVLDLLATGKQRLSEVVDSLPKYTMCKTKFATEEQVSSCDLDRVQDAFPEARADRRDGLRLDWDHSWVHIRGSNTEPIIRVISEAASGQEATELAQRTGELLTRR